MKIQTNVKAGQTVEVTAAAAVTAKVEVAAAAAVSVKFTPAEA